MSKQDHDISYNSKIIDNSMFIFPTCEKEILDIIKCLKNKSSCGHDGISNLVVKISATVPAPFLAHVFNECFKEGIIPDSLKIAKVIALHKSGDKTDPNKNRPISLLPVISKIYERIVYNRINNFLKKHKVVKKKSVWFSKEPLM